MCWIINKKAFEANPERYHNIAQEDIIVYKVGYKKYNKFRPFYKKMFSYKAKSLNDEISLHMDSKDNVYYFIGEGYHSYSEECNLISCLRDGEKTFDIESSKGYRVMPMYLVKQSIIIGKFIIPKGSEYYENKCEEIVSSNIIWTGEYHLIDNMEIGKAIQFNNL